MPSEQNEHPKVTLRSRRLHITVKVTPASLDSSIAGELGTKYIVQYCKDHGIKWIPVVTSTHRRDSFDPCWIVRHEIEIPLP